MADKVNVWRLEVSLSRMITDQALGELREWLDFLTDTRPDDFEYQIKGALLTARSDEDVDIMRRIMGDCLTESKFGASKVVLERIRDLPLTARRRH